MQPKTLFVKIATLVCILLLSNCRKDEKKSKSDDTSTEKTVETESSSSGGGSSKNVCKKSGSWSTVDDYNLVYNQHAYGEKMYVDDDDTVWTIGSAVTSVNRSQWLTRITSNGGESWSNRELYQFYNSNYNTYALSLTQDSSGTFYALGYGQGPEPLHTYEHGLVRKSTNGLSWTLVEDFQYTSAYSTFAYQIGVDSSDAIYWVGAGRDSSNVFHWIVRKSSDHGSTWSTVDNYNYASSRNSYAFGLKIKGSSIYVMGAGEDSSGYRRWIVRKSTNAGSSWNNIDDYQLTASRNSESQHMTIDKNGALYVAGVVTDSSNHYRWMVRKSTDGSTWSIADNYEYSAVHGNTYPHDILATSSGIVVVGEATDDSNYNHWLVRRSTDSGATWSNWNDWQYNSTTSSLAYGIVEDSSGALFVNGNGKDASLGTVHALVRKYCE